MPVSPNPDNYTLPRGRILFDGRDLGNAPSIAFNVSFETLTHANTRSGLKSIDKTVKLSLTPKVTFSIDEMTVENVATALMADVTKVTQAAADVAGAVAAVALNRNYKLINTADSTRKFKVGLNKINHGVVTDGPFTVGETVTGGTSSATGDVIRVDANTLGLSNITGTFEAGETLTGGTSTATATSTSAVTFDEKDLAVSVSSTVMTKGTDYTVDGKSGRIVPVPGGAINDGDTLDWEGSCLAHSYSIMQGFKQTSIEGSFTYIPDVPEGNNIEMEFWKVSLSPTGDIGLISDEFMKIDFEGEILKDEVNHPDSPYFDGFIDDVV